MIKIKKLVAKIVILASIIYGIIFISAPVLAATGIHPNILHLIGMNFNMETPYLLEIIDAEKTKIIKDYADDVDRYIDTSTKRVVGNVEAYIQNEVNRIDSELNIYQEELYLKMDDIISSEEEDLKAVVDNYIDLKIQESKDELDKEIIDVLVRHLQEGLDDSKK